MELENVEVLRSQAVEKELRCLVDDMVSTAYRMPGEIERIAEVKGPENACKFSHRNTDNDSAENLYTCTSVRASLEVSVYMSLFHRVDS